MMALRFILLLEKFIAAAKIAVVNDPHKNCV